MSAQKTIAPLGAAATKFNPERLMTVLLAPTISEKATHIADKHEQVVFRVAPNATKPEVKAAVFRSPERGVLVLPMWLGKGAQFVPGQCAAASR